MGVGKQAIEQESRMVVILAERKEEMIGISQKE